MGEKHLKEDMLAYDYGEAKDKGVKIKSVALYKRERNEPDEFDRLPVQDMLGTYVYVYVYFFKMMKKKKEK